jgi:hypothetical protein
MPDPINILTAMGVAFAVSAILLGAIGWLSGTRGPAWVNAGWVVGLGAGFLLGCWVLGNRPHWPLREDQDRFFVLVFPAVMLVELLAVSQKTPRWIVIPLRAAVVIGTAPVLLLGTSYLSDQGGPGTAEWSTLQACLILGGLAAFLATVWSLLSLLNPRAPGVTHALCLAIASAGGAIVVMLSGYASGGQNGLTLAAAVCGAAVTMAALRWSHRATRPLGAAIVALYSLLVVGRFFGELGSTDAALLFASPLLGWLPELPGLGRLPRWARNLSRLLLVGILVSAVVFDTARNLSDKPAADSGLGESPADYDTNFGR